MSNSPLTDAFVAQHVMVRVSDDPFETVASVRQMLIASADFARKLERDRAELLEALESIVSLDDGDIALWNFEDKFDWAREVITRVKG